MNKTRYKVIKDYQGGEFGMGRCYTAEQWQKQALEWCYGDDNDEIAEIIDNIKDEKEIIQTIGDIWALEFKKVRKDKKNLEKHELEDFEDETLKEFYSARFHNSENEIEELCKEALAKLEQADEILCDFLQDWAKDPEARHKSNKLYNIILLLKELLNE